jgi:hypothetical protein
MDDDLQAAYSPSPPAHSPRSEASPSPSNWTSTHEQAAQEAYELELAEQYLYDLVRRFASATRALSLYDSPKCLAELEQLPYVHQTTPWVLAMIGRAHYEQLEYAHVGPFFPINEKMYLKLALLRLNVLSRLFDLFSLTACWTWKSILRFSGTFSAM